MLSCERASECVSSPANSNSECLDQGTYKLIRESVVKVFCVPIKNPLNVRVGGVGGVGVGAVALMLRLLIGTIVMIRIVTVTYPTHSLALTPCRLSITSP